MFNANQKRMLALDGGGIMGAITLQILKRMETQLRTYSGKGNDFVLSDFFDYFGGTSTGAIIASGLAMGKSVDELIAFYDESGRAMFRKASWFSRLHFKFAEEPLVEKLQAVIGHKTLLELLDAKELKGHLLIVTRNASTDSSWPLSTNPNAKYNDLKRPDSNLKVPLWQLVRASTAAPTFFKPEVIDFSGTKLQFVDGAITPYNSPAFLLYKMATMPQYRLGWPAGEDRLMLISIGTGFATSPQKQISTKGRWLLSNAATIPSELMRGIQRENDMNCRMIGRCVFGKPIDSEVGDMIPNAPLSHHLGRAFLYARYDADISVSGLKTMGLADIDPNTLVMDNVAALPDLKRIGEKAAEKVDMPKHFETFM